MIEGLWVARFLAPQSQEHQLNGGVVVIESGRVFGGDSGYYYVGELGAPRHDVWPISIHIHRHDPTIESVFGDAENFSMRGILNPTDPDAIGREVVIAELKEDLSGTDLKVRLTRVADLP